MIKISKKTYIGITTCVIFLIGVIIYITPSIPNYDIQNYYLHTNKYISKIDNFKPIYFHNEWLYCSDGDKIVRTNNYGETLDFVANIEHSNWILNVLKRFYLTTRIARLDVYRLRVLQNGTIVFSTKEGIFRVKPKEKTAKLVYKTDGSRPISLTVDKNDTLYFGEYHSNPNRNAMAIFASYNNGNTFERIYSFPSNTIRHIHAVEYDKYDDCLWVATGDTDSETYLLRMSLDCKQVETIAKGGQKNRYFEIKVLPNKIFITPDAPSERNQITIYDKKNKRLTKLFSIESPAFFSTIIGNYYFFATSNEPSAKGKSEYLASHVYAININTLKYKKIGILGTDILYRLSILKINPIPGLFQFSQPYFPEGESIDKTKLVIYGNGLKGFWNDAYLWDISNLNF